MDTDKKQLLDHFTAQITESKDGGFYLKGMFAEADMINGNGRIYPQAVLESAVQSFKEKALTGMDGHPHMFSAGSYRDVALKFEDAWLKEKQAFCKVKVLDTSAGKDLRVIAEEGIPIGLSMRGYGEEKFDKELKANVVQEGYQLAGIDAVLEPAFEQAKVIREQKEKQANEGGKNMDELKKLIESLQAQVKTLEDQIKTQPTAKLDEETKKLIAELKTDRDKKQALLDAKKKAKEILESDELKDYQWKDNIAKHLEECVTVEEVEKTYPRVKKLLDELVNPNVNKPEPQSQIVEVLSESGFYGAVKVPDNPEMVYRAILDKFENKPMVHELDNPRNIAAMMLENNIRAYIGKCNVLSDFNLHRVSDSIFKETRSNPLFWQTKKGIKIMETLGDTEMYTGDVTMTAGTMLPMLSYIMKDVMDLIGGIAAIQPIDRSTADVWWMKEYYENASGTGTEISANFSRTESQVAEAGTPKQLRVGLAKSAITLETALKTYAPFTIELQQDLMSHFGLNVDSILLQTQRKEIFREIAYQVLYSLLTATALAEGDGLVVKSTKEFKTTAPAGYTQEGWDRSGLTKAVKQAGAEMDVVPYEVTPDWILSDSALTYLFTAPQFVADDSGVRPSNFGFRKTGSFSNEYSAYFTSFSEYDNIILMGYRGTSFAEAAMAFLPYVLLWIGPIVPTTTAKFSRTCVSRFAIKKLAGAKLVRINVSE
jgi:hypothetical protein